jgi:hypothetical protein
MLNDGMLHDRLVAGAHLPAADTKITDVTIVRQIERSR